MKLLKILALVIATSAYAQSGDEAIKELNRKINILADEIEALKTNQTQITDNEALTVYGLGRSGSKVYKIDKGVSIGGYGEVIYKNKRSELQNGQKSSGGTNPVSDALRNVIYVGYKFNQNWVFNSEIEIEHADEVFAEFAYLDYLHSDALNARFGLILAPMGFINELHEATTFLSVNRPDIESKIIPSTWRENGLGIFGSKAGFEYRLYLMNGLNAASFTSDGVRGGRKKGTTAESGDLAWTGRLDYVGVSNLLVGVSAYVGSASGTASKVDHNIYDFHLDYKIKGIQTRFLYVHSTVDAEKLNQDLGLTGSNGVGEELTGWYWEVGYNVLHNFNTNNKLIPFARYETYDTQAEASTGLTRDASKERENITLGLVYQPIERISFKFDYIIGKNEAETGTDSWNLGMGWNF